MAFAANGEEGQAPGKMDMEKAGISFSMDLDTLPAGRGDDAAGNWTPGSGVVDKTRYWLFGPRTKREILIGNYNLMYLCCPTWPYCNKTPRQPPAFFGRDEFLGIGIAIVMGLQHALAMLAGLITPPLLISYKAYGHSSGDPDAIQRYLIQASLIVCGIMTFFQVLGLTHSKISFQWGAGILSVMGVSFATVPVAEGVLDTLMAQGFTFEEAYGKLLGTLIVCAVIPILYSFLPVKVIRKLFPPLVTGITIVLIGLNLVGTAITNWGGGIGCTFHYGDLCHGNGDVMLPFGSAPYVGLGFMVFSMIILLEIFGSPFMRNASVILALLVGYGISAGITYKGKAFVTNAGMASAPVITFLWTTTFPLGFYAPAIIPLMIVFSITSIECIGDTTASRESSRLSTTTADPEYNKSIKGALLNDGISGIFSALATMLPMTTYAQNNGVIALTNVASRQAGFACAAWLFGLGILGKTGAWVASIPNCILGGMTTFLFANLISSGIKLIVLGNALTRRSRFIMGCAFTLGVGVTLYPTWATYNLWPADGLSKGVGGIREAIILILSTGFCIGAIVAFTLNIIMPDEAVAADLTFHKMQDTERARVVEVKAAEMQGMYAAPEHVDANNNQGGEELPLHSRPRRNSHSKPQ